MDFVDDDLDARRKAGIAGSFIAEPSRDLWESSGEYYQRHYPNRLVTKPEVDQWYKAVTTWMPADAEKWWLEQFKANEHLDAMPQEWWRQRTRNLIIARDKDTARPVGAVALTMIYMDERNIGVVPRTEFEDPFFHEIRGLVVDESYRGERIGRKLVRAALEIATASDIRKPTVAVTTNPAAARLFETMKGELHPTNAKGFPDQSTFYAEYYNKYLCWERLIGAYGIRSGEWQCSEEKSPCGVCPKTHDIARWWPTHDKKRMAKLKLGSLAANTE